MESKSAGVNKELLARIGLENEAHLKAATASSSRKQRMVEKMMVAELHNMRGELAEERSALRNENQTLRDAIEQLRLGIKAPATVEKAGHASIGTIQEGDVAMEEVG